MVDRYIDNLRDIAPRLAQARDEVVATRRAYRYFQRSAVDWVEANRRLVRAAESAKISLANFQLAWEAYGGT